MEQITPIDRIFKLLGGPSAVAKLFLDDTGKPLTPWAVAKWRKRIPAERVLALEKLTLDPSTGKPQVTRYEMRPDVYGQAPEEAAA